MKFIKVTFFIVLFLLGGCTFFKDEDAVVHKSLAKFTPSVNVKSVWSNKNNNGAAGYYLKLTPAVSDGKVFTVCYRGVVKAIDSGSGKTLWENKTGAKLTSGVAADDKMIFVGSSGQVIALRQNDGKIMWRADVSGDVLARPVATQDKVIVKSEDGKIVALASATGAQLWSHVQDEPGLILRGSSAPVISGNRVICGFADGQVVALDLANGSVVWNKTIATAAGRSAVDRLTDIAADPAIVDGVIYTAGYHGAIAAMTLDGKLLWQNNISSHGGVVVFAGQVYAADASGAVYAYDRKSGRMLWKKDALLSRSLTTPVIYKNAIVLGDDEGYLHFLNVQNGDFAARIKLDSRGVLATPVVANNSVYVYSNSGSLVKYTIQ